MKEILYKTCFNYFKVEYFLKKANFSLKDRIYLVLPFNYKLKRNTRKDTLFKIGGIKDGSFFSSKILLNVLLLLSKGISSKKPQRNIKN